MEPKRCTVCGREPKVQIYSGEPYCCDNCRKIYMKEWGPTEALDWLININPVGVTGHEIYIATWDKLIQEEQRGKAK